MGRITDVAIMKPIASLKRRQEIEETDEDALLKSPFKDSRRETGLETPAESNFSTNFKARRRGLFSRFYRRKYWSEEIVCLILVTSAITVVAVVLHRFDGKEIEDWRLPMTLNAFVAWMATFTYMLLVVPLSAAMAQVKWNSFHKPNQLYNFHVADRASRGTFGALLYITRGPQSVLGAVASLLLLVTATLGPFIQQVVHIKNVDVEIQNHASLPVFRAYNTSPPAIRSFQNGTINTFLYDAVVPIQILNAVQIGILSDSGTDYNVTASCSSGRCTFGSYSTLAIQSHCSNVTDHLAINPALNSTWMDVFMNTRAPNHTFDLSLVETVSEAIPLVSLSNGFNVSAWQAANYLAPVWEDWKYNESGSLTPFYEPSPKAAALFFSPYQEPITLDGDSGTFINLQAIYAEFTTNLGSYNPWHIGATWAYECTLGFVNQTMTSSVQDGKVEETAVGEAFCGNETNYPSGNSLTQSAQPRQILLANMEWASSNMGDCIVMWPNINDTMPMCMADDGGDPTQCCDFRGFTAPRLDPSDPHNTTAVEAYSIVTLGAILAEGMSGQSVLYGWPSEGKGAALPNSRLLGQLKGSQIEATLMDIAALQTNKSHPGVYTLDKVMMNVASSMTKVLRSESGTHIYGTVHSTATVYDVSWGWLAIPLLLIFSTALLVGATARDARIKGVPIWTTSSLATMVHGLDAATKNDLLLPLLRDYRRMRMRSREDADAEGGTEDGAGGGAGARDGGDTKDKDNANDDEANAGNEGRQDRADAASSTSKSRSRPGSRPRSGYVYTYTDADDLHDVSRRIRVALRGEGEGASLRT